MSVEAHRHGQRRGTAAEWTAANPILAGGELGIETDTSLMKIGDGATMWTALDYANRGPKGDTGDTGPAGPVASWDTLTDKPPFIGAGDTAAAARAAIGAAADSPAAPDVQNFTASGIWTKPAGAKWVRIELIGAGGGSNSSSSGGGGGGAYVSVWVRAADLAATVAVTIGAGGTSGGNGGSTTFGSLLTAVGGKGTTSFQGADGGTGGAGSGTSGTPGGNAYFGGGGGGRGGSGASSGGNSAYGGGGGGGASTAGQGGLSADAGALLGGNGGTTGVTGTAPGGAGGSGAAGARGAARITSYF